MWSVYLGGRILRRLLLLNNKFSGSSRERFFSCASLTALQEAEFVKFRLDELRVLFSPKFYRTTPKFKFDDASLVKFNAEFDESIGKFQAYRFRYPSV